MKRTNLLHVLAVIGIAVAMLFPTLSEVNAVAGFIDSGIELPGIRDGSVAWGDYNNDGYIDLAVCGNVGGGSSGSTTKIYRNNGDGTFTDIGAGLAGVTIGSVAWGDYDNDGDLDLALCGNLISLWSGEPPITRIYRNNGDNTFTDIGAGLAGTVDGSVAWGDYDNDGDLDLVLCGNLSLWSKEPPITRIYRNNGDNTFTDIGAGLTGVYWGSLAWGDYDNDGDLDLVVCGWNGSGYITRIYRNNGDNTFTDIGAGLPGVGRAGLTGVGRASLAWGDYDNDGDLDLVINGTGFITRIYKNNGDNTFTDIGAGLAGVTIGSVAWGDYNNDGYIDLAVCGSVGSGSTTKIYKNNGDNTFTDIGAGLTGVGRASLAWGDYDNDGNLDLAVCGQSSSTITTIYKNVGNNNPNALPFAPTNLTYEKGSAILKWDSGYDEETPDNGLYYNIRVGTSPGANDIVSGVYGSPLLGNYLRPKLSDEQLGIRLNNLPPNGVTYYWSVKTIDTGLQASEWSNEGTFVSNHIPIADAGEDQTVYAWIDGMAEVTLDGSGSYDEDGDELTYLWLSNIDGSDTTIATGVNSTIELPVGEHTIKLIVNDGIADSESDEVVINVVGAMKVSLQINPQVIHRNSNEDEGGIMAWMQMPEDITRDQIDENTLLKMYPGDISAIMQQVIQYERQETQQIRIHAFFSKDELLGAVSENGSVELKVVGKLKTGQYFYGTDTVDIRNQNSKNGGNKK